MSTGTLTTSLYQERIADLDPYIRFCQFKVSSAGGARPSAAAAAFSSQSGEIDSFLQSRIDALLKESRLELAKSLDQVQWQGKTIPILSESIKVAFYPVKEQMSQLSQLKVPFDWLIFSFIINTH